VPTVDGPVDLKIPAGSQPEDRHRMSGRGVVKNPNGRMSSGSRGDQFVTVKVEIPKRISESQRRAFEVGFGLKKADETSSSSSSSSSESSKNPGSTTQESKTSSSTGSEAKNSDSIFSKIKKGLGMDASACGSGDKSNSKKQTN
jgi:molecular chaperone DnaJ